MSDEKQPVPTAPGWWWRERKGKPACVRVDKAWLMGNALTWGPAQEFTVLDDGRWIAPAATPDEVAALRERAEQAEAALSEVTESWTEDRDRWQAMVADADAVADRYREAVGRLRGVLESCRQHLQGELAPEEVRGDDDVSDLYDDVAEIMAATSDEALGHDAPPPAAPLPRNFDALSRYLGPLPSSALAGSPDDAPPPADSALPAADMFPVNGDEDADALIAAFMRTIQGPVARTKAQAKIPPSDPALLFTENRALAEENATLRWLLKGGN